MTQVMERWDAEALANDAVERRMVPRLLDFWKALGDRGSFPSLKDFNVEAICNFPPHCFVLDLTGDPDNPVFRVVGIALTVECGRHLVGKPLSATPRFSLLSRLIDHNRQVLKSKIPAEFEAEYVTEQGVRTVYRAILLPFGEDRQVIDHIVGAITWRTMLSETTLAPPPVPKAPAREAAGLDRTAAEAGSPPKSASVSQRLSERLREAQKRARQAEAANARSRKALYQALESAYAVYVAAADDRQGYAALLARSGLRQQDRAPFVPLVKLVFGAQFEKTRLSEYAAALSYAKRCGQTADTVAGFIESRDGGIKGCVAAERAARRAEKSSPPEAPLDDAKRLLRQVSAIGEVSQAGTTEFVIMLGRRTPDRAGTVRILRVLDEKPSVVDAIVRRAAKSVAAGLADAGH